MLIVISPAKSLDFESKLATKKFSQPELLDHAEKLVDVMATKTPDDLRDLMGISQELAELNVERFQDWEQPFTKDNARPALLAFSGDVYLGIDAPNRFSERDFTHAQKTLRILSGLYGVLRPLDLMQPYRLEMGSQVDNPGGKNLYEFWGSTITEKLNEDLADSPGPAVVVNLASNEYFSAVVPEALDARIISPKFLDEKNGQFKIISFFAKRARGEMAAWLIQNRVKTIKGITEFDGDGYRYDAERSTPDEPVFVRPAR
jgi:cytoplasmic iron level regulating protein YaaA (DUF328/UPF0246 family)